MQKKVFTFRLSPLADKELHFLCEKEHRSQGNLIEMLLHAEIERTVGNLPERREDAPDSSAA